MNPRMKRWLPVVALILAWQVFLWQLPQAQQSGSFQIKELRDTVISAGGQAVFSLAETKPPDVKNNSPGKWFTVGSGDFSDHLELAVACMSEEAIFAATRIWLLHRALLL